MSVRTGLDSGHSEFLARLLGRACGAGQRFETIARRLQRGFKLDHRLAG